MALVTFRQMNQQAITLTELMISMAIVGIVMLGVVSADFAMQRFYNDSKNKVVSGFNAIGMVQNINNAAFNAQGSFTNPDDKGIVIDSSIATAGGTAVGQNTFCFRNYADPTHIWQCYSILTSSGLNYLYTCNKSANPPNTSCNITDTQIARITSMSASFTVDASQGTQRCLFKYTLVVPDSDNTTRTYTASMSPPNYRL